MVATREASIWKSQFRADPGTFEAEPERVLVNPISEQRITVQEIIRSISSGQLQPAPVGTSGNAPNIISFLSYSDLVIQLEKIIVTP